MAENGRHTVLDAQKVDEKKFRRMSFLRDGQALTYTVKTVQSERRQEKRVVVRLQSGKVLDVDGRFLADFLFVNRGSGGVRITLTRHLALPRRIWLYEDLNHICWGAEVVWQNGGVVGCRYRGSDVALDERLLRRFRAKYYALR
ncbi:hypothetical protein [Methylocystis iwaonis]|uniref:hypothetical protein n=1 Tax=Methylocystis iwaonis TaxID=2885079 RepID=UPI002E7C219E|nr:hypothetical protein [Methylocystis iwaonis]